MPRPPHNPRWHPILLTNWQYDIGDTMDRCLLCRRDVEFGEFVSICGICLQEQGDDGSSDVWPGGIWCHPCTIDIPRPKFTVVLRPGEWGWSPDFLTTMQAWLRALRWPVPATGSVSFAELALDFEATQNESSRLHPKRHVSWASPCRCGIARTYCRWPWEPSERAQRGAAPSRVPSARM